MVTVGFEPRPCRSQSRRSYPLNHAANNTALPPGHAVDFCFAIFAEAPMTQNNLLGVSFFSREHCKI